MPEPRYCSYVLGGLRATRQQTKGGIRREGEGPSHAVLRFLRRGSEEGGREGVVVVLGHTKPD
jgi:hypothetical protein